MDDDSGFRGLTKTVLGDNDQFTVETASSAKAGLELVGDCRPDCIVSDYNMPGRDGLEFLQAIREDHPELPFILFTGKGSESVASEAIAGDVTDYLQKSRGSEQYELLSNRIQNAVQARRDAQRAGRHEELMRLTEYAGDTGGWELAVETNELVLTDGTRRLIGVPEDTELSLEEAIELYHPDDREAVRQAINRVIETGRESNETWCIQPHDGDERHLEVRLTPVTANGEVTRIRGIINDITKKRKRQRELERTETLFENTQDGLFLVDVADEFTIEQVNPAWENTTGRSAERARGRTPAEIFGAESAAMEDRLEECIERREPLQYERTVEFGGETRHLEVRIAPVVIDGTVEYIAGSTRNVTEQREQKQELEAERQFVEQALDSLEELFYVVDTDGGLKRWNERLPEVTGYTESELAGMEPTELVSKLDREDATEAIETVRSSGDVTVEADILTAEDQRIPYEFTGGALTGPDGNTTGFVGIGRDISERRRRKRRFQALVEESNDIISVIDADGRFAYQSPSVERILGYHPEETVGDTAWEYIHPDDRQTIIEAFQEWINSPDQTETVEYRAQHADGSWRWMEARLNNQTGNPAVDGFVINSRDITDRKEREQQLQRKNRAIEAAPVGITITDPSQPDNPIIDVNDRFVSMTGYPREKVLGRNHEFLSGEQTSEATIERLQTRIENEEPVLTEFRSYRKDGTMFWSRVRIAPVRNESGELVNYVWFGQDVTDQKQDKRKLEKREQTLRELHTATREFYPPSDSTEISEFLVRFLSGAFELPYISVKQFDEAENCLQPAGWSSTFRGGTDSPGPVEPGPNPIWSAYEQGDPQTFDIQRNTAISGDIGSSVDQGLAFPVGDFGVIVVCAPDDDPIDDVARDLLEVVAANAEYAFERLRAAETHADVAAELSTKQAKVEELATITGVLQELHDDLAAKETTDALDRTVCNYLTRTDRIDFAWIGRPEGVETNLQPATWAGQESGYLNKVDLDGGDESFPAQRVATEHEPCSITDIGSQVTKTDWAKHALTAGFQSVFSVPLVYDGVLYGVLSVYSTDEEAFEQTYRDLVTNAGSLLVSYRRTLANRYEGTRQECTMLEFELSDPAYPFHRLAATTGCRIRVDTVVETTATAMQLLVTVQDGDPETVLDQMSSVATITDVDRFGHGSDQLSVSVQKPFLASVIGKHGAVLFEAVSDSDGTSFRVKLPRDTPKRPVLDSLLSEYQGIVPVAQRQLTDPDTLGTPEVDEILTDRQQEVLRAAFHGGYYETPKEVKGKEIAANFDISNTAVYDHLRTSHRRILETALESEGEYQQ